mmetsp:Transcript_120228/g.275403  ORF Transcript_120228/g.275403 Transcript_120228/m.275403 type:complete len:150 (+) Transcript_120228:303-752(+)
MKNPGTGLYSVRLQPGRGKRPLQTSFPPSILASPKGVTDYFEVTLAGDSGLEPLSLAMRVKQEPGSHLLDNTFVHLSTPTIAAGPRLPPPPAPRVTATGEALPPQPQEEQGFLRKYWWIILMGVVLVSSFTADDGSRGGGGGGGGGGGR